ncbi:MAG: alpha/beta hydrolase, partial [Bdellovibrionota bacterium]|nr:alpha/beta hydrolase [Bdellovibrionota bacterium]
RGSEVGIEDLINELNDLVTSLSSKPILLGHSWGGVLGTEFTKRFQDKIYGLILMCTGLSTEQWILWNDELDELGLGDASAEELFLTSKEKEEGAKLLRKTMESFCGETFDSLFSSYLENYNLLEDLKNIKLPILNIYGENDLRFSKEVTTSFRDYNESIVDFEVLGAGHFPFLDLGNREKIFREVIRLFK